MKTGGRYMNSACLIQQNLKTKPQKWVLIFQLVEKYISDERHLCKTVQRVKLFKGISKHLIQLEDTYK